MKRGGGGWWWGAKFLTLSTLTVHKHRHGLFKKITHSFHCREWHSFTPTPWWWLEREKEGLDRVSGRSTPSGPAIMTPILLQSCDRPTDLWGWPESRPAASPPRREEMQPSCRPQTAAKWKVPTACLLASTTEAAKHRHQFPLGVLWSVPTFQRGDFKNFAFERSREQRTGVPEERTDRAQMKGRRR